MSRVPTDVELVDEHLQATRDFDFTVNVASSAGPWVWHSGEMHHVMADANSLYRSITQAWDFPVRSVHLSDRGEMVHADLTLDNGNGYEKRVFGEYRVRDGRIVAGTLHDSPAVRRQNG